MGMDLTPRNSRVESIHYNWNGWSWMCEFIRSHVPAATKALDSMNDGKLINATYCRAISQAITEHAAEYDETFGGTPEPLGYGMNPAVEHAKRWRESGGFNQW